MNWQRFLTFWRAPELDTDAPTPPPNLIPTEEELKDWASSGWVEYQAWLFHHCLISQNAWQQQRDIAHIWHAPPTITLVTPVYNTTPAHLLACIYAVQTQSYPFWEWCLVDDGSTHSETKACLTALLDQDPRIKIHFAEQNQGICAATNHALSIATSDYVGFLDHDDRLAPNALFEVAQCLYNAPHTDIIYSDRDMLSPQGLRFMHLFKPDWSPETLLSGNYLFHLLVYRRTLLTQLGGVRSGFEGSQDYDLILRAAEMAPCVAHIPAVLYHWRQHSGSVALEHEVKAYAYQAGIRALEESLERRGVLAQVSENPALWRGNYRLHFTLPATYRHIELRLNPQVSYAAQLNQALLNAPDCDALVVLAPDCHALDAASVGELLGWLQLPTVALATGKVLDSSGQLLHAGLVQRRDGVPLTIYAGYPENTAGYMAVTAIARNVSTPHPACFALKRQMWQTLGGFNGAYHSEYAVLDLALRALQQGQRCVYTPFARFQATDWPSPTNWSLVERCRFVAQWRAWLNQGDPYYNPHLTLDLVDMGLDLNWTPHSTITL